MDTSELDDFWSHVRQSADGCGHWTGPAVDGWNLFITQDGPRDPGTIAYEQLYPNLHHDGTMVPGCGDRACIRPAHIRPQPTSRKTRAGTARTPTGA